MKSFEINEILDNAKKAGERYHEFLRVPALSVGLYELKAGADDPQSPHQQDEVYYLLSGRAKFQVDDELQDVAAGSILYVEAPQSHKFVEIVEDLQVLVFFAPAEDS
jgi:mannose-6-phosphate isomerase-like protein (cupin superfamily)